MRLVPYLLIQSWRHSFVENTGKLQVIRCVAVILILNDKSREFGVRIEVKPRPLTFTEISLLLWAPYDALVKCENNSDSEVGIYIDSMRSYKKLLVKNCHIVNTQFVLIVKTISQQMVKKKTSIF